MIKLTHLFVPRENVQTLDVLAPYIDDVYLPLAAALPGTLRLEQARIAQLPLGSLHVLACIDQYFDDEDAMNRAMASPEGRRLARELMDNARQAPELLVFNLTSAST